MDAFLRVLGWSYIIAVVLVNVLMGVEVYRTTPANLNPWEAVFNEYGVFTFVFWVEVIAILLPGVIMLAIRDIRIKLKEKALADEQKAEEERKEGYFITLTEQEAFEKEQNNCSCADKEDCKGCIYH